MNALLVAVVLAASPGSGRAVTAEILPTTVATYGDSLTQGACVPVPYPAQVDSLPGYYARNRGISAETAAQITTRYFANYNTDCLGELCGTYMFSGGTNDCMQGACEPASVLATMLAAVDDALSRGRQVVWLDIPPFLVPAGCGQCLGGISAGIEKSLTYNALQAAACQSSSRPNRHLLRCVSTYPSLEENPASTGGTRGLLRAGYECSSTDRVHNSQAGADVLSDLVLSALQSFPSP